jgi:hypothetical protein
MKELIVYLINILKIWIPLIKYVQVLKSVNPYS